MQLVRSVDTATAVILTAFCAAVGWQVGVWVMYQITSRIK